MSQDQLENGDVEFSYQTPEQEKERRLQAMRERFSDAMPITAYKPDRPHSWRWIFLSLAATAAAMYFFMQTQDGQNLIGKLPFQKPDDSIDAIHRPAIISKNMTLAEVKEIYWSEVYTPSTECRQAKTSLKTLECRNQTENARRQFERQWANKLATGWIPRELK